MYLRKRRSECPLNLARSNQGDQDSYADDRGDHPDGACRFLPLGLANTVSQNTTIVTEKETHKKNVEEIDSSIDDSLIESSLIWVRVVFFPSIRFRYVQNVCCGFMDSEYKQFKITADKIDEIFVSASPHHHIQSASLI